MHSKNLLKVEEYDEVITIGLTYHDEVCKYAYKKLWHKNCGKYEIRL
jgi:hypothetical protein